jgi:hypothetical protein
VTERLPAWVTVRDGKLVLIPERAEAVRLIFRLAADGYGTPRILARLNRDGVAAFGGSGKWTRGYVGKILRDRRALGEYQPRRGKDRVPDGDVVADYFPRAVSEELYLAARAGAAERGRLRGRLGSQRINLFSGLVRNALDGDSYFMTMRFSRGTRYHVLLNRNSQEGAAPCRSFPYPVFEDAVLSLLAEIDPSEVVGREEGNDSVRQLAASLAGVDAELADASAYMEAHGFSATIGRRVTALEARRRDLADKLARASAEAANPLAASWGEYGSLLAALATASDPEEARLRLRSVLRRVVAEIRLLVVPRGLTRLAAVQVFFANDGRRSYLVAYTPPHQSFAGRKDGRWHARGFADVAGAGALDLRRRDHAEKLEKLLARVPLDEVDALE